MTSAETPASVASERPKSVSTTSRIDGPRSATFAPSVRCAATGANTSRPWNVGWTGCRQKAAFVRWRTSLIPMRLAAGTRSPLSGPTKIAPSHTTAIPRRSVPTPGSTTPTWIANGKCGAAWNSANAPSTTFPGATSWRTSTICASRLMPRMTPFIAATYSDAPKSVVRVTITRLRGAGGVMTLPPDPPKALSDRFDLLALQDWNRLRGFPSPSYRHEDRDGDNDGNNNRGEGHGNGKGPRRVGRGR